MMEAEGVKRLHPLKEHGIQSHKYGISGINRRMPQIILNHTPWTKNGDNYNWRYIYTDKGREYDESRELIRNKDNDYRVMKNGSSYSRIVFRTVTANSIELEYWDGYYREGGTSEYGIVNLVK